MVNEEAAKVWHLRDLEFMSSRAEMYWGMSREKFLSETASYNLSIQVRNGWRLLENISGGRCCPKAESIPCMCEVSYRCPDHGVSCKGSHD